MLILVTYDVNQAYGNGAKRLRKVAKICTNYGLRVQKSVFECNVTPMEYAKLKIELKRIIDDSVDNIRLYNLGNNYTNKVDHLGVIPKFNMDDVLIL